MKYFMLIASSCCMQLYSNYSSLLTPLNMPSFDEVHQKAFTIPDFVAIKDNALYRSDASNYLTFAYKVYTDVLKMSGLQEEHFRGIVDVALHENATTNLKDPARWVDGKAYTAGELANPQLVSPYIQGIKVEAGTRLLFLGDSHADFKSRVKLLYKEIDANGIVKDPNTKIIILGDITDRGSAGAELLAYFLRLKLLNPNHFFIVRGNHEDVDINKAYGFIDELVVKFPASYQRDSSRLISVDAHYDQLKRLYNTFPVALFIGSDNDDQANYLYGCHGFGDSRYNPERLLSKLRDAPCDLSLYERYPIGNMRYGSNKSVDAILRAHPHQQELVGAHNYKKFFMHTPAYRFSDIDFLWGYIDYDPQTYQEAFQFTRTGIFYGKPYVDALLSDWSRLQGNWIMRFLRRMIFPVKNDRVNWIFRAHQHTAGNNYEYSNHGKTMQKLFKNYGIAQAYTEDSFTDGFMPSSAAYTLAVAPNNLFGKKDGTYPGFNYDTMIEVIVGTSQANWKIKRIHKQAFEVSVNNTQSIMFDAVSVSTYMKNDKNFYQ